MQCDYCGGPHGYSAEGDWSWPRTVYLCILCRQAGITLGQANAAHAQRQKKREVKA